jgi:PTH1 family peptidyl-tRNA hydrolase
MKMIVGLGNPGTQYEKTRHNLGFRAMDWLAETTGETFRKESKFKAEVCETMVEGNKVLLVKPQTFMNNSGEAVQAIKNYYRISEYDIIVFYDDNDLPFGETRSTGTSSGGHKGMESVMASLGTNEIARVRLGINNDSAIPTENFVLMNFKPEEEARLNEIIEQGVKYLLVWLKKD